MQNRKKLLLYRSWHRGCKETDILLGEFAKDNIDKMTASELSEYEFLVDMDDTKLYKLLTAGINENNSLLINQIISFNQTVHIK